MKKAWIGCFVVELVLMVASCMAAQPAITQDELVHHTQELFDAVASGDRAPWQKYFADDALYFDEKGRSMTKKALLEDLTPLPKGYAGTIKIMNPQSRIIGDTAILSYDMDETEIVFGQNLKARYHATDTWMFRNGQWQVTASQVLRYYEDPAPGKADASKFANFVGTYELAPETQIVITAEGGKLYAQRTGRQKEEMIPESSDVFFRKGVEGRRLFQYDVNGKVDALIDRRNNEDIIWKKVK
ncbi:MAG TPA: DUF4440 domain-containing protein [Acidobacteriota bacterium]|nr:DUF4440 domain-containing protein [Acidobacteriota bacterium]